MKRILLLLPLLALVGCGNNSVKLEKPIVVTAKHVSDGWWDRSCVILRGADGSTITLTNTAEADAIVDTYNVGDTIR